MKAPVALALLAGCATGAATVGYEPCPQGQRFVGQPKAPVGEAYGVGGLGLVREVEGGVVGGVNGGVLRVLGEKDVLGKGNVDRDGQAPGPVQPLADVVLEKVELVHTTLGRGARSDGQASYKMPAGSKLFLQAKSSVPGYGWNRRIGGARTSFGVGCHDRPRHVVDWTFVLRDEQGRESNSVRVPVTCTGEPMPGSAPQLDGVDLDYDTMVAGQRTGGVARLRGTHPPLQLIAASSSWGYGWSSSPVPQDQASLAFGVGCRKDRPAQTVRWRFSVKDSFGRVSNVIEKPVHCGLCVAR